jgi:phosphatidyl-myo-inositol alpha-mannosyltransferase
MGALKVGIVAESYFPSLGGIQEHVRYLRNYLQGEGVEVTILTGRPSRTPALRGPADAECDVVRVGRSYSFRTGGTFTQATLGPLAVWKLHRALRDGQFDLLNIHGASDFGLPFFALSMFRGPKVLTLHSCFPDALWRRRAAPYYRWVFGRSAAVIAVSKAAAQSMGRYVDFHPAIIPNGVDVRYWKAQPNPRYCRPGHRNIVYLGRLEERNGPDLVIEAFGKIAARVRDVRLLVAGDGLMRPTLEARVPGHMKDRVEFLGAVYDQRPDLLASASAFLLPARAVGFSIMVLEAYAAGLPVVALPALGYSQAGDHWSNVILARDCSAEAFADAVVETLQQDQTNRIARGRAIAGAFDWMKVGPRILDVFREVAQSPARVTGRSRAAA